MSRRTTKQRRAAERRRAEVALRSAWDRYAPAREAAWQEYALFGPAIALDRFKARLDGLPLPDPFAYRIVHIDPADLPGERTANLVVRNFRHLGKIRMGDA